MTKSTWHKGLFLFLLALTINYCRTSPVLEAAELPALSDPTAMALDSGVVWIEGAGNQLSQLNGTDNLNHQFGTRGIDHEWAAWESNLQSQGILGDILTLDGLLTSFVGGMIFESDTPAENY